MARQARGGDNRFGEFVRRRREMLRETIGPEFSLRSTAKALGVSPGFLSQVENGLVPPPDALVGKLAEALSENPDVLAALAGKVPGDVGTILRERPSLLALVRALRDAPEDRIVETTKRIVDEGEW